jgi:hypothetical protein
MPLGEFQEDLYVGDSLPLSGPSTPDVGDEAAMPGLMNCCDYCIDLMSAAPEIAADLLQRATRRGRAKGGCAL